MKYPKLNVPAQSRSYIDTFYGYNHNLNCAESEFYEMKNLTSDYFPALAPRKKRGVIATVNNFRGMTGKDNLAYVDGSNLVYGDKNVDMGLSDGKDKQLISMGAYVCVFPDKKKYNTYTGEWSNMEVSVTPSTSYWGRSYYGGMTDIVSQDMYSSQKKDEPADGDIYMSMAYDTETKTTQVSLMKYYSGSAAWFQMEMYQTLVIPVVGTGLKTGDYIDISGFKNIYYQSEVGTTYTYCNVSVINGQYKIYKLIESGENTTVYIKCPAIESLYYELFNMQITSPAGFANFFSAGIKTEYSVYASITFERKIPEMDYVCELNNRLWGCSGANHEIYASKLGDPDVWYDYSGLSTDSYAVTVGSDGEFTGCARYNNSVLFFKENMVHKMLGTQPANFQLNTIYTSGVQKGCSNSICLINEVLYYKSEEGVCYYDGSTAEKISDSLGLEKYGNASGGGIKGKYYISMQDEDYKWHMFAYDIRKGMWHREDSTYASAFAVTASGDVFFYDAVNKRIYLTESDSGDGEASMEWEAVTGNIGYDSPDHKYLSRFNVRLSVPLGEWVAIDVEYDSSGVWEHKGTISMNRTDSITLPVVPKRCDHMRIRFRGNGTGTRIFSIAKIYENGSDA